MLLKSNNKDYVQEASRELIAIFHTNIMEQNNDSYNYLIERGIEPTVIENSVLGSIPKDFSVIEGILDKYISEVQKETEDKFQNQLKRLEDIKTELSKYSSYLVFPYIDYYKRLVKIRFRKPFTESSYNIAVMDNLIGVFFLEPYKIPLNKIKDRPLLIVEDEFNLLHYHSLRIRNGKNYSNICAVGKLLDADFETLSRITEHWDVCYDNYVNNENIKIIEDIQKNNPKCTIITAFTVPEENSTLDKFIKSYGENYEEAFTKFNELKKDAKKYFCSLEPLKQEVNALRAAKSKDKPAHIRDQEIAELVIKNIKKRAVLYKDISFNYLLSEETKKITEINEESQELINFFDSIGINPTEKIFKYLVAGLSTHCSMYGKKVTIRNSIYYDKKNFILYVNNGNKILKITKDNISEVSNGTDGILFKKNKKYTPFKQVEIEKGKDYLYDLFISKINFDGETTFLNIEEQQTVFKKYFYSLFFESIMPTKPILTIMAEKGSGKTTSLRIMGKLIFGNGFDVTPLPENQKDFDAVISNSYFLVLDNVDSTNKWLNDRLACLATGQTIKIRRLYSNNDMIEFKPKVFTGITTRTPKFKRDDVADRLVILNLKRFKEFIPEDDFINSILKYRNEIMSQVLQGLQGILEKLEENKENKIKTTQRMGDFAAFLIKTASSEGEIAKRKEILDKLSSSQAALVLDEDPLVEVLIIWLNEGNEHTEIESGELFSSLKDIAIRNKIQDFNSYKSTRSMGQRLKNIKDSLIELQILDFDRRTGSGGKGYYKFKLLTSPEPNDKSSLSSVTIPSEEYDFEQDD